MATAEFSKFAGILSAALSQHHLLPRSGIKPMSPALAGGFLTTEPPGKPLLLAYCKKGFHWSEFNEFGSGLCLNVRLFPKGLRRIRME